MSGGREVDLRVFEGSSARMDALSDREVGMVFTSPPYFSDETEERLRRPLGAQSDYDGVLGEVTEFALGLRPVFEEVARVLQEGRFLVVQTKHLRYGDALVPLLDLHTELALSAGFRLVTRVDWLATAPHPLRVPAFARNPRRLDFRAMDTETFLVFRHGAATPGAPLDPVPGASAAELVHPLWRTAPAAGHRHPYASPPEAVRRFVLLLSEPGDLVLDPFCGFGTTLRVAVRAGRRAVGYDVDHGCVLESERGSR